MWPDLCTVNASAELGNLGRPDGGGFELMQLDLWVDINAVQRGIASSVKPWDAQRSSGHAMEFRDRASRFVKR